MPWGHSQITALSPAVLARDSKGPRGPRGPRRLRSSLTGPDMPRGSRLAIANYIGTLPCKVMVEPPRAHMLASCTQPSTMASMPPSRRPPLQPTALQRHRKSLPAVDSHDNRDPFLLALGRPLNSQVVGRCAISLGPHFPIIKITSDTPASSRTLPRLFFLRPFALRSEPAEPRIAKAYKNGQTRPAMRRRRPLCLTHRPTI